MSDFTALPIPYVPIADKAAEVRLAIDAARLSAANSFGGLQKLAIPGPFATDAEANTFGVPDDNLYYRSDGTVRAASHISLDLAFALDKTLTARTGPTPTFSRASSGLFVNANGILVGKTAGTTASITPSTTTIGTTQVTVTVASGSVVGWVVGQSVSLIVDADGGNDNDASELWLVGTIVSTTATQLVFTVTEKTSTVGSATDWTLGYRGARFDHDATGVCKGLLIEESRTNFITRSEELNDASWTKSQVTVNENTTTSPSGIVDADKVVESTALSIHRIVKGSLSAIAGTVYSVSVYAKADGRRYLYLNAGGFGSNSTFDLESGVVSATQNGTASITNAGNGWWRCVTTGTAATTQTTVVNFQLNNTSTASDSSYTGDGTSGIYLWGAQLEAGAFPTSYIPTTIGTAARSADVCSIIGDAFASFYNQSEGTLFSNCSVNNTTGVNRGIATIRSTAVFFMRQSLSSGSVRAEIRASDTQTNLGSTPVSILTAIKMALAYSENNFASSTNGTSPSLVTRTLPTGLNEFRIGSLDGTLCLNGHIDRIQYFRKRLSNAKLQTLTTP